MRADVAGNESDFLVAMSKEVKDKPVIIPAGTSVTFDAVYKPETHYGAALSRRLVGQLLGRAGPQSQLQRAVRQPHPAHDTCLLPATCSVAEQV